MLQAITPNLQPRANNYWLQLRLFIDTTRIDQR